MAVKNTGLITKGLRSEFFQAFNAINGRKTHWQDWATRIDSNTKTENYRWLGQVPAMREWGTGRKAKGVGVESYSVSDEKYELTIEVDRDEVDDDQTGQIRLRIGEIAQRAATHPEYLITELLKNGTTSGFNSYDGVTFFNDAHVSGASGSNDNSLTGAIVAADTPTEAECRTAFGIAVAQFATFNDDQGEPMDVGLDGLTVVCAPATYFTWYAAMFAGLVGGGNTNTMPYTPAVVPLIGLTDVSEWYLLRTGTPVKPFIFQDRMPIEFGQKEKGSDEEFDREKYQYGVRARYKMAYGRWENAILYEFTTA